MNSPVSRTKAKICPILSRDWEKNLTNMTEGYNRRRCKGNNK